MYTDFTCRDGQNCSNVTHTWMTRFDLRRRRVILADGLREVVAREREKKISRPWLELAPCLNTTWRRFDEKQLTGCSQRREL